ncbi:MAG: hypothetical protein JNK75_02870 [Betaproteobacteria bacterium]|nr:hypothetical protein [Betaproteobacteria bacterium]
MNAVARFIATAVRCRAGRAVLAAVAAWLIAAGLVGLAIAAAPPCSGVPAAWGAH